jgi:hypothetical protein
MEKMGKGEQKERNGKEEKGRKKRNGIGDKQREKKWERRKGRNK